MLEQELTYTQDGLRKTVTDDRGTTTYEYDPDRRRLVKVIPPNLSEVSYTYDYRGRMESVTDPRSNTTECDWPFNWFA